ncbi:MAG: tetratricopeptide repeat protein [Bacteroidales bacterium]
MKIMKLLIISLCAMVMTTMSFAQKTAVYESPEDIYESAYELFQKEKYHAAQQQFEEVLDQIDAPSSLMKSNAEYYSAICALELFNEDAEDLLKSFIEKYPEHSLVRKAHFQLGKYQYRKKRYRQAIRSLEMVDVYDLNTEEKNEFYFKLGYSYFKSNDYDKAKNNFYKLIQTDNQYIDPATYYYGHIAYENGNYETALNNFNKLIENEIFKPVLPYYITQIYYKQEKYDKLLEVAPGLLEEASKKRKAEIARLIGDAYYTTGRYRKAVPYLEQFFDKTQKKKNRDDYYQIAYAYYRSDKYDKAIQHFDKVTATEDTLAQNAYYHMADCYLKTDEKKFAYNAFLSAYKNGAKEEVTKDALFNYAKLAYELSYDPYNEAIQSFQKFIKKYPEDERIDEANSYLVKLFLSTKNYKNALKALEKIEDKSTNLEMAYQQVAYYRGVELFNNQNIKKSISLFQKSTDYNYDKELYAKAHYWIAEGYYRNKNYTKALEAYKQFQLTPGAFRLAYYNESNYNIGYAYFKNEQYRNALTSFRKFLDNTEKEASNKLVQDALLRTGDCYYSNERYSDAVETYKKAVDAGGRDVDYALYQKAVAEGVMGDFEAKIQTLKTLVEEESGSTYADDAAYELANTYLTTDNNENALEYYNKVINNYPNSNYLVKAMQKKGLVYYNTDNYELALNTFKDIRQNYPGTKESKEALVSIRNIYTNMNEPEAFFKYAKENAINLSTDEQDSTMYHASQKIYMDGDCEKAIPGFNKYLKEFPKGIFTLNARYYLADCLYRHGDKDDAAEHYKIIADTSFTRFKEKSVSRLAEIYYNNKDFEDALNYYQELEDIAESKKNILEARKYIMRCYYKLDEHRKAIAASKSLMETDKVSDEWINEAYMTIGKSALAIDSISTAKSAFSYLTGNLQNELAVEAKYLNAEIEYNEGDLKEAENLLFEIINQVPSYDYWIGKSFILIADIYLQRDNVAQAKATLNSIIDNYRVDVKSDRPNLVEIAKKKLNEIRKREEEINKATDSESEEDMELDYSDEEGGDLFETELLPDTTEQQTTPDSLKTNNNE